MEKFKSREEASSVIEFCFGVKRVLNELNDMLNYYYGNQYEIYIEKVFRIVEVLGIDAFVSRSNISAQKLCDFIKEVYKNEDK